jgi:hypothetical protein
MHVKSAYRKKRIDPHYLQRGGAAVEDYDAGGMVPPQPGEMPPGMPAWEGVGPAMSHPFGNYMSYPSLKGGYNQPINLNQAPPMMQAMAAQQRPQQGYAQGGQLQPKDVMDIDPAGGRAEGEPPIGSLTLDLSRMKPTPLGMSPLNPKSPAALPEEHDAYAGSMMPAAPPSRTGFGGSGGGSRKAITLSREEVSLAHSLKISVEEFARQKARLMREKKNGNYLGQP